jgi:hypothetical protein
MTLTQLVNLAAMLLTCAVVFQYGARPERIGLSIVAAAFLLTPLVEQRESWLRPQWGILTVDVLTLAALVGIAFWWNRAWPICAAAFQAIAALTDVAFLIGPRALYRAYYVGNFAIGFLLLGAILGGVVFEAARPVRRRRAPWPSRS